MYECMISALNDIISNNNKWVLVRKSRINRDDQKGFCCDIFIFIFGRTCFLQQEDHEETKRQTSRVQQQKQVKIKSPE